MSHKILIGMQWGDEGKGKITDLLAEEADVVVRFSGGNNAGHTVIADDQKYELHLIPSGILYPEKLCLIGSGVVIHPRSLVEEMNGLKKRGIALDNLHLSPEAHLVLPYHVRLDNLEEEHKAGDKIGTTGRGIGPAYADKAARRGLRVGDLLLPENFGKQLEKSLSYHNAVLEKVYQEPVFELQQLKADLLSLAEEIRPHVTSLPPLLWKIHRQGRQILFEGAQGALLDLDFGTYPYVTSSHPGAGGVSSGTGFGPRYLNEIVGVAKAYLTRVGQGPFPTELSGEQGEKLREKGQEFGVTTGRPRRCGWLDLPALRYAAMFNSVTALALTKLDVLSGFSEIKVCTGYKIGDSITDRLPDSFQLKNARPVYQTLKGWQQDISGITKYQELPSEARHYVNFVEQETGVKISLVSTGPERKEIIHRQPL